MIRLTIFCLSIAFANSLSAQLDWPSRHGPDSNGIVPIETSEDRPPTHWNEEENVNIAWKLKLPDFGHSTPIVGMDRVFLTSATEAGTQQFLLVIDEESGDLVEQLLLFENQEPEPLGNPINTYASPTSILEEDALYVHFGTYGTARLNPITLEVDWTRRDINCRHFRGPGSSPIIYNDLIILTFDGIDQQFLIALDKQTGDTIWRTERSTDYGDLDANGNPHRDGDLRKAYGTPGIIRVGERDQLVSIGSRAAFGYDVLSGDELWTVTHDDYNAAAPPIFYDQKAILNTGGRGANLIAVRLDETTQGDITESHVAWNRDDGNSRLSTPVANENLLFMITDRGVIRCVDMETGEEVFAGRSEGNYVASPIRVDDLIYFFNEEGQGTIIRASNEFEIVAENSLAEGMRSSPAVANGALYLRTFGHLYKIQE